MQKIMLVCGGLGPGRDGVGDYCRRLATELGRLGVACLILALNDGFAAAEIREPSQGTIDVIRLPAGLSAAAKRARMRAAIDDFDPDWISLQFVSYGFNSKGMPLREVFYLPPLFRGRRLHVMVHEVWIGTGVDATLRNALIGTLQRRLIVLLLRRLQPYVLTTTVHFLQRDLARAGIAAEVLPLFGNIPVTDAIGGDRLREAVMQHGGPDLSRGREALWVFAMFGVVFEEWPAEPLISQLAIFARRAGRRIVIVSAGNAGARAPAVLARWRKAFPEINFVGIGSQSAEDISRFLNWADFGITSHPLYAVGKSGSVNAMLEHGLPVIVSWGDIAPDLTAIAPEVAPLLWRADAQLEERLMARPTRRRHPTRAAEIAQQMLTRLAGAGEGTTA